MTHSSDKYADYVEHPRYGRRPKITGLNPETDYGGKVFLHWHSPKECRIPNTAIVADTSCQAPATVPVTHYYDVERRCRDCGRTFVFFAEEQKHWYETLGFKLEADCVRCPDCRKRQQGVAKVRGRYEELYSHEKRTDAETLELAECCLALIETEEFTRKQLPRVRAWLKSVSEDAPRSLRKQTEQLLARVRELES